MSAFYVYFHTRLSDGSVFYVGKGTKLRYKSTASRSKDWIGVVEAESGFKWEIVKDGLTEQEALTLENALILEHSETIVNKHLNNKLDYYAVKWSDILKYDESSPTKLVCTKTGKPVGYFKYYNDGKPQEITIRFCNKSYRGHIVVMILHGVWSEGFDSVVNHIDNNPHNNSIDNLEVVSRRLNAFKNYKLNNCLIDESSNYCISIEKHRKFDKKLNKEYITDYVKCRVAVHGVRKSYRFSIQKYGFPEAMRLAREKRDSLILLNLS